MFYEIGPIEKMVITILFLLAVLNADKTWPGLVFLGFVLYLNRESIKQALAEKYNNTDS